ncbi:hypothetical protein [Paenarthrobacter aromaticivorans]|uniref:Uncharacterized protein n=1 Tax=Paenarthrobacter aromaticivorans TaxID=2849150 RepID=A0ABS6ICJ9_9MICC|nr:hypothetical protein [Paenarthrobacter sp. MMS21-TAE1-1]MBU8868581.1 hypothetical protein [Paenarthrobacter sp. MMS21-TAE1-1]
MGVFPTWVTGDPVLWILFSVLGVFLVCFTRTARTLLQILRIELWARFAKRHHKAGSRVQKLIEEASRQDLLSKKRLLK